jgi:hypothetical protein
MMAFTPRQKTWNGVTTRRAGPVVLAAGPAGAVVMLARAVSACPARPRWGAPDRITTWCR